MKKNVWIKSTRSGDNGQCVTCKRLDDGTTLVKDSKEPNGAVLSFTREEWAAFIGGIKSGEFDL